ncbi:MAG: UDP-N-acetylmuramate--L-alanine ligase [Bacteroidales bacterium]|jgi:UDP-N-acetylmuramate--alanine ligase|nr:UDP-N-acetylmuramate--L-alanine ligase [Bacteroidales bacterium]
MELLQKSKRIYFLGIGGIGMSALARYCLQAGKEVYGYDLTSTPLTDELHKAGAHIHYETQPELIPEKIDFAVYTPAVSVDHAEYQYFVRNSIPIFKRAQLLGMLSAQYPTIAVAGTHGKTTTTAITAQLLHGEKPLMAFIGGIAKNFDSNFILDKNLQYAVVEADEFDKSFLSLSPAVAVITSMDADHLDIYGDKRHLEESFRLFAQRIVPGGTLVIHEAVADRIAHPCKVTYGLSASCDYRITELFMQHEKASFRLVCRNKSYAVQLGVPGMHNILNATAAFAAVQAQFGDEAAQTARFLERLARFNGVKRRFDYQIIRPDLIYIDDYAHHPEELRAIITAVKNIYADKRITGVFQPHLFTRTRDFAHEFADALGLLDEVILLEIYPARELPIAGINSTYLLGLLTNSQKQLLSKEALLPCLQQAPPQVLLTLGAGDIDRLVPILRDNL